jgi:hypothetical protein
VTSLISNHFCESVSSPEKAGVGGSIPSLATILINNLATAKTRVKISRAHNTRTSVCLTFTFGAARSNNFHTSRSILLGQRYGAIAKIAFNGAASASKAAFGVFNILTFERHVI